MLDPASSSRNLIKSLMLVSYNTAVHTKNGRRYVIDQIDMVIGRSPECSITVNEQSVSRKHASCTTIDGEVSIQDLGSNGTFVNDNKIDTKTFKDGILFQYDFVDVSKFL